MSTTDNLPDNRLPDSVDRQQISPTALYLYDAATGKWVAAALDALGGSGGGTGGSVTATYPPQTLTVGVGQSSLTVPTGANRAQVTVTAGLAHIGLGDANGAPVYAVSEGVTDIQDAQLAALRMQREGQADATVRVDYWTLA